ncbi:thiosulfohydrolase SoxB [Falsiroseomonas bella]|uniref:Thiosulfohydrolase SoxB n=1 Tax=Falsiroseomonas bella TaxID=2184016 RepID=A0A317FFK7_9PROT|nr:thiosulfohydrolase SoxB [Falsiroseomonas bella]PWS37343.1 thiosulfohydrolase SoxB [Falsiroseomonas bella]
MLSRRDLMAAGAALAALGAHGPARGQTRPTQADLLRFDAVGQVTLVHVTDLHAQLVPMYFREATTNVGVGEARGVVPHLTGRALLDHYRIPVGSPMAHALAYVDFDRLARAYGPMGGLDRIVTLIKAIRAERPGNTLVLDGGDTLQGSWTALQTKGGDMVEALKALTADATTGHWEFTYGADRVKELVAAMSCAFLAGNVQDTEWNEDVFDHTKMFERGGVKVAVIGQAFPYTPIANPRWMIPDWAFGIKEDKLRERVQAARDDGAQLVVLLSHNGFDVDRKLAGRVEGIDVILTAHTHDALPEALRVGNTLLVASGCHGKFISRLDLRVEDGRVVGHRHALIPVFADAITPDAETTALVQRLRAPYAADLARVVGHTETTLWRRGNLNGTMDDVILAALMEGQDAEIALSPAFRWGYALLANSDITAEDVWAHTAMTYPAVWRQRMTGAQIKTILEDVADNLYNPDPYYQQGGDMVRVGGIGWTLDVAAPAGRRISDLTLLRTGRPIEATREYTVAGWASVAEGVQGPPVWEVLMAHLAKGPVRPVPHEHLRLRGA